MGVTAMGFVEHFGLPQTDLETIGPLDAFYGWLNTRKEEEIPTSEHKSLLQFRVQRF